MNDALLSLLCSSWSPAPETSLRDLDGRTLADQALAQGVGPLLYGRLRGTGALPPEAEEPLRQAYYANAARNARILRQLEDILAGLAAAHIDVLLLKGAALALVVYDNPALRPLGDLDLLVRPADVDAALGVLDSLGYRPLQHEPAPGSTRTYENEIMVGRAGALAPIEVHWGLFDSPHHQQHLDMDWFWETSRPIVASASQQRGSLSPEPGSHAPSPEPDAPTPTPSALSSPKIAEPGPYANARILGPEAQLLHLCGHLALHHGDGGPHLLWMHDIAEVVARYGAVIDWPAALVQARAGDLVAPLQQALPRVAADWRAPIPPAALEELARLSPSRDERRIMARLAAGPRPSGRRLWDDIADTPSWGRRLRQAWVNLFPTPAYMRQRYGIGHPLLVPFYYPYRWFVGLRGMLLRRGS